MTDRIQNIIDDIRHKSAALHQHLLDERDKNSAFQSEIQLLTESIEHQKQEENKLLSEITMLKAELEMTKSQVIENSHPSGKKDEEIDELVKEIEHCISQLKK
jgi:septal ring factor EnvC (AmiA/AmiB activator)